MRRESAVNLRHSEFDHDVRQRGTFMSSFGTTLFGTTPFGTTLFGTTLPLLQSTTQPG